MTNELVNPDPDDIEIAELFADVIDLNQQIAGQRIDHNVVTHVTRRVLAARDDHRFSSHPMTFDGPRQRRVRTVTAFLAATTSDTYASRMDPIRMQREIQDLRRQIACLAEEKAKAESYLDGALRKAAEIVAEAREHAGQIRDAALADAKKTRAQAVQILAHVRRTQELVAASPPPACEQPIVIPVRWRMPQCDGPADLFTWCMRTITGLRESARSRWIKPSIRETPDMWTPPPARACPPHMGGVTFRPTSRKAVVLTTSLSPMDELTSSIR